MLDGLLAATTGTCYVHYFEFTDRVQHMMFRYFDPKHPAYTAEGGGEVGRRDPGGLPADGRASSAR